MGKDLKCSYCERRFSVYRSLRRHENVHTGNLHHCDQCNKGFTDPWILRRHLQIHARKMLDKEDPIKFPCKQCGIVFLIKKNLESHLCEAGIQGPPKIKYQCSECRVTYTKPSAIRDHKCSKPSPSIMPQISRPQIGIPQEYILPENVPGGYSPAACPLGDAWPVSPEDTFSHERTGDGHREETFSSRSEYGYRSSTPETWTPYTQQVPEAFPSSRFEDKSCPKWVPGLVISPEGGWETPVGYGTSVSQTQFMDKCVKYENQIVECDENQTTEYYETSEDHFAPECHNGKINGYLSRKDCNTYAVKSPTSVSFLSHKKNLAFSQTSFCNETAKSHSLTGASVTLPSISHRNNSFVGGTLDSSKFPPSVCHPGVPASVCYPGVIVSRKSFKKTDLTVEVPPVDENGLESDGRLHKSETVTKKANIKQ